MSNFMKQIDTFGIKTKEQMKFFVTTICNDIATGVIMKTPVDTGRARANWFASLDAPIGVVTEKTDKSGDSSKNNARAMAENAAGRVFYLSNNLPYIRVLEYGLYGKGMNAEFFTGKTVGGYSKQAPAGMVRITLNEVVRHYS